MEPTLIPQIFWDNIESHFGKIVREKMQSGFNQKGIASFRNHPYKGKKITNEQRIPWCENGYFLDNRPVFALDPLFHTGAFYVQDSSSMILRSVLERLHLEKKELSVLDACAAPGGKSTLILDYLDGEGFLIANEIDGKRNDILEENITKWGFSNVAITRQSTSNFSELKSCFDLVVVDAPCSGEGMFRKDQYAIKQWNESLINQCVQSQQIIVEDLTPAIKQGGYLIYCTCTSNLLENEDQIIRLIKGGEYELATPDLDDYSDEIIKVEHENRPLGYYLLPGIAHGEGQFIAVLRKTSDSGKLNVPKKRRIVLSTKPVDLTEFNTNTAYDAYWAKENELHGLSGYTSFIEELPNNFHFKMIGLPILEESGKKRVPLHGLVMDFRTQPNVNIKLDSALSYLRKETNSVAELKTVGWQILGYENRSLGWVKSLQNRYNNYYPNKFRLRLKQENNG
jgi:16S rRNA C967 or C1407 C5-methylase (RsmB/RsmF family)